MWSRTRFFRSSVAFSNSFHHFGTSVFNRLKVILNTHVINLTSNGLEWPQWVIYDVIPTCIESDLGRKPIAENCPKCRSQLSKKTFEKKTNLGPYRIPNSTYLSGRYLRFILWVTNWSLGSTTSPVTRSSRRQSSFGSHADPILGP